MKIKAKDMCPRCKYCLGMTPQGMYSCGKADDGSELNIGIDVILNCANFEWKDGKVEGKVADFCPKCKNCKSTTMECDGKKDWLTEVECEDPYDGMTKTLNADSDICCERFDGTYCHTPKGIYVTSYMGLFGDYTTGNCPLYEEKKEPHETKTARELKARITALLSEKAAHLKDIERLNEEKKSLTNMVKRRDRWIDVLKADIDGLQTDMLKISKIRDIAQKVYDDTNRD